MLALATAVRGGVAAIGWTGVSRSLRHGPRRSIAIAAVRAPGDALCKALTLPAAHAKAASRICARPPLYHSRPALPDDFQATRDAADHAASRIKPPMLAIRSFVEFLAERLPQATFHHDCRQLAAEQSQAAMLHMTRIAGTERAAAGVPMAL